tara:strand:- start:429 stop:1229 length:801 start_codon:yes stop_codon:yes gene_type:complete
MNKDTPMIWSGQGPVMIGTFDTTRGKPEMGYLVDLYRIGCGTSQLNTNLTRETKELKESCSGQRLTLKELETGKAMSVSLAMYQFSGRTLAAALYSEALEVASGAVTDEVLAELAAGDYFTLRHTKVSDVVIVDSSDPVKNYVLDTNYTIEDADHARMRLLEHPADHTEPVMVDYSYGAYTNMRAFSKRNVERGVIFNGVNQDGQKARLIIPRVNLALGGDFGWISDEEASLTMSGNVLYVPELEADDEYGGFARVSLFDDVPVTP